MTSKKAPSKLLVLATALLVGCGTTEHDWQLARDANTSSAYADFLAKHPQGAHVDEAKAALTDFDWKTARDANTTASYSTFLAKYSKGPHADEARVAIDDLDWNAIKAKNSTADYNRYLQDHSAGRHTADAKAAIEAIDAVKYVPLNLPCGARVAQMGFTFFGTPSGELVSFDCQNKQGKTVQLKLRSKNFTDGKIETVDFGVIRMKSTGATSAAYEILQGQLKKLQAQLEL